MIRAINLCMEIILVAAVLVLITAEETTVLKNYVGLFSIIYMLWKTFYYTRVGMSDWSKPVHTRQSDPFRPRSFRARKLPE